MSQLYIVSLMPLSAFLRFTILLLGLTTDFISIAESLLFLLLFLTTFLLASALLFFLLVLITPFL